MPTLYFYSSSFTDILLVFSQFLFYNICARILNILIQKITYVIEANGQIRTAGDNPWSKRGAGTTPSLFMKCLQASVFKESQQNLRNKAKPKSTL